MPTSRVADTGVGQPVKTSIWPKMPFPVSSCRLHVSGGWQMALYQTLNEDEVLSRDSTRYGGMTPVT